MMKKFDSVEDRKTLLRMKAQLQRLELLGQVAEVREQFAWVHGVRKMIASLAPVGVWGGQIAQLLLRKHPVWGALTSAALVRYRRPLSTAVVRTGVGAFFFMGAARLLARLRRRFD